MKRSVLCALLLLWGVLLTVPLGAQSNVTAPKYAGVDILFIIDQSGSMGGPEFRGVGGPFDPDGLRFTGPQYAVEWLSTFVENIVTTDVPEVRIGLLSFGSITRNLIANWTPIDARSASWPQVKDQILQDISAARFGQTNLGSTDFQQAFQGARTFFQTTTRSNSGQRLSVIIVLTDGGPCTQFNFERQQCNPETEERHLNELTQQINRDLANVEIYIIAIDRGAPYWPRLQDNWQGIACSDPTKCDVHAQAVQTNRDLSAQFNTVLADIIMQVSDSLTWRAIDPNVPFDIPPYTQILRLNVFKTEGPTAGVFLPSGAQLVGPPPANVRPTAALKGQDSPIEIQEVRNPAPGAWTVDAPQAIKDEYKWAVEFIAAGLKVVDVPTDSVMYTPFHMTAQVVDVSDTALERYPANAYGLTVELVFYDATVLQPADRPEVFSIAMQDDPTQTTHQYITDFRPTQAGLYEIRANACYTSDSGALECIANDQTLVDSVRIEAARLEWQAPSVLSQRAGRPIELGARVLNNATGQPLAGAEALSLRVSLLDANGQPVTPPQVFAESSPAQVQASVTYDTPGNFVLRSEIGTQDSGGAFIPLIGNTATQDYNVEIRPVQPLTLSITQPTQPDQPVQKDFPEFWIKTPTTVRVELRDNAGQPVSLVGLTNGQERIPALTIMRGSEPMNISVTLSETSPGVYEWSTDELGEGQYTFTASTSTPNEQLSGDYLWEQTQSSVTQSRYTAPYIYIIVVGLVLTALILIYLFYQWARYQRQLRVAPLNGSLSLMWRRIGEDDDSYETLRRFNLGSIGLNTKRYTRRDLPPPYQSFTVTNNGDTQWREDGTVKISGLRIADETIPDFEVHMGEYYFVKDGQRGQDEVQYFVARNTDLFENLYG